MKVIFATAVGLLAGLATARVAPRKAVVKPIVAHYMVGGVQEADVQKDIDDAKKLGLDGFALNYDQFEWWSNDTVRFMFDYADKVKDFKLFFSFDHGKKVLTGDPMQYADYFMSYIIRDSYFTFKDPNTGKVKPLLSTFGGESVPDSDWAKFKNKVGPVLIVPGFYEATPSANFFNNRGSLDGVFNWNSWQPSNAGKVRVSSEQDSIYQSATTKSQRRVFMMGISPVQFKHLSEKDNWYRRGEDNLEYRLGQALELQPDIIQLQSWNDAGEGHYMGNLWPEPLDPRTKLMTDAYPHQGYWEILGPFIQAWKRGDRNTDNTYPTNGKAVQGAFWHHTITVGASCPNDKVPKAADITNIAENAVSGVVLVPKGKENLVSVVSVGGQKLDQTQLKPGYNLFKYRGMGKYTGKVQLEVWDGSTMVGRGEGKIAVSREANECNYNFQVVPFPS